MMALFSTWQRDMSPVWFYHYADAAASAPESSESDYAPEAEESGMFCHTL